MNSENFSANITESLNSSRIHRDKMTIGSGFGEHLFLLIISTSPSNIVSQKRKFVTFSDEDKAVFFLFSF